MDKKNFRPPLSRDDLNTHKSNLNKEFAKYEVMKQELSGFRAKKQEEFEAQLDSLLSDEERDIVEIGGNTKETYRILKAHENTFVENAVAKQEAMLEEFEDKLHKQQAQFDLLEVETNFMEQNPDADFEGLINFITMQLNAEQKGKFLKDAGNNHDKFLDLVNKEFISKRDKPNNPPADLPTDLNGIAGATGDIDNGDGMSDEDDSYARQAGLYR